MEEKDWAVSNLHSERVRGRYHQGIQMSSSGAKSHFRVAIFLSLFPGEFVGGAGENMLSASFN